MEELIERQAVIGADGDCISRQVVKDALADTSLLEWEQLKKCYPMLEVVDEVPSTQPELIRCKDCKHYQIYQLKRDYTDDKRFKPSVCVINSYAVKRPPEWFCADAERRSDEQTLPE